MGGCALPDCDNTPGECRLFTFPRNEARRNLWISRCYLTSVGRNARLCEAHFDDSQFELRRQDGWKRLRHDAVPTLFPEPTRIYKMNFDNGQPTEIIRVLEDKPRKRKLRKKDNEKEDSKKACLETVKLEESAEQRRSGKLNKVISCPKSKTNSRLDGLGQIKKIKKQDKVKSFTVASNSKIVKNTQHNVGISNASNCPQLFAFQGLKIEPEDQTDSEDTTENSTVVKKAKAKAAKPDDSDSPQFLALVKQWNAVLKEELVELRMREKTEKLKNEYLLERTMELEKTIEKLKCEKGDSDDTKELEKENKMLKHDIDEMQCDKKEFELQKQAFLDIVKQLQEQKKYILSENENMKLQIKEFDEERKKFLDAVKENKNLKCENDMLGFHMKAFNKNNKDMCKVIVQLRKHNKLMNERLLKLHDDKIKEAITLKPEKELLQAQVEELKSQNQTMINENECMLQEVQELIMNNKSMRNTITELETYNSDISCKLKDLKEENQSMSQKILDLENQIKVLTTCGSPKMHSPMSQLKKLENVESYELDAM